MIKAVVYRNKENCIYKFRLTGHAGFAQEGSDIVCAAVSVLVLNTINAIEAFTEMDFSCDANETKGGFLEMELVQEQISHDASLLLETMAMGLRDVAREYSGYIKLIEEV